VSSSENFVSAVLDRIVQALEPDFAAVVCGPGESVVFNVNPAEQDKKPNPQVVEKVLESAQPAAKTTSQGSALAVPYLDRSDNVEGVLYIEVSPPRRLKKTDLAILQRLRGQIESRHDFKIWKQTLGVKEEAARKVALTTLDIILKVLKPPRACVFAVVGGKLKALGARESGGDNFSAAESIDPVLIHALMRSGSPTHLQDALSAEARDRLDLFESKGESRSVACCPLRNSSQVVKGLVFLDSPTQTDHFDGSELLILERLAQSLETELAWVLDGDTGDEDPPESVFGRPSFPDLTNSGLHSLFAGDTIDASELFDESELAALAKGSKTEEPAPIEPEDEPRRPVIHSSEPEDESGESGESDLFGPEPADEREESGLFGSETEDGTEEPALFSPEQEDESGESSALFDPEQEGETDEPDPFESEQDDESGESSALFDPETEGETDDPTHSPETEDETEESAFFDSDTEVEADEPAFSSEPEDAEESDFFDSQTEVGADEPAFSPEQADDTEESDFFDSAEAEADEQAFRPEQADDTEESDFFDSAEAEADEQAFRPEQADDTEEPDFFDSETEVEADEQAFSPEQADDSGEETDESAHFEAEQDDEIDDPVPSAPEQKDETGGPTPFEPEPEDEPGNSVLGEAQREEESDVSDVVTLEREEFPDDPDTMESLSELVATTEDTVPPVLEKSGKSLSDLFSVAEEPYFSLEQPNREQTSETPSVDWSEVDSELEAQPVLRSGSQSEFEAETQFEPHIEEPTDPILIDDDILRSLLEPEPEPEPEPDYSDSTDEWEEETRSTKQQKPSSLSGKPSSKPSVAKRIWRFIWPFGAKDDQYLTAVSISGEVFLDGNVQNEEPIEVILFFPQQDMRVVLRLRGEETEYFFSGNFAGSEPPQVSLRVQKKGYFPAKIPRIRLRESENGLEAELNPIELLSR
jgi:hypothetical protein